MKQRLQTDKTNEPRTEGPALMKKRGVATLLAVSPRLVDDLKHQGLPYIKFGPRCVRYPRQAVLDWLAAHTIGGAR